MAAQHPANDTTNPWLFMGFDLRRLLQWWLAGWREALNWPVLAWLKLATVVRVYRQGAEPVNYAGGRWLPASIAQPTAKFVALILEESIVLRRELALPPLSQGEMHSALSYEVAGATPFGVEQTVWGWRIKTQGAQKTTVELVLTARAHIERAVQQQGLSDQRSVLEIWVMGAGEQPIVLTGYAEGRRWRAERRHLVRVAVLLGLIPALLMVWAAIPLLSERIKLRHAQAALAHIQSETSVVDKQREHLAAQASVLVAASQYRATLPPVLDIMALLSQKIPDSAYLERLDINTQRTTIEGQADNAAALMQILSGLPQLTHVRAPSAITRNPATGKERFMLEFSLAGQVQPPEAPQ